MSNRISPVTPGQHSPANSDYTNSTAVAAAWLITYAFLLGGGLMVKPAAKQTAEVVAQAVSLLEQQ